MKEVIHHVDRLLLIIYSNLRLCHNRMYRELHLPTKKSSNYKPSGLDICQDPGKHIHKSLVAGQFDEVLDPLDSQTLNRLLAHQSALCDVRLLTPSELDLFMLVHIC